MTRLLRPPLDEIHAEANDRQLRVCDQTFKGFVAGRSGVRGKCTACQCNQGGKRSKQEPGHESILPGDQSNGKCIRETALSQCIFHGTQSPNTNKQAKRND